MSASPPAHSPTRRAWLVLTILLGTEALVGVVALIPLGIGFFGAAQDDLSQRVSVLLAGLLAILWVAVTFIGALRTRTSWVRGSAITLHVLMFAAGTGALQYALAAPGVSWGLIAAAFLGFFTALLARPEQALPAEETEPGAEAEEQR